MTSLSDLGEREIVRRLKDRYAANARSIGDDCAIVARYGESYVVATTDPAPRPVAWDMGFDDFYYWGWLLAALNLSDLNAAGATPTGLLSSLTLPTDFPIEAFDRLLAGIDDACAAAGTEVIGGNLREDPSGAITCEGTGLGVVNGPPLRRVGARAGQILVAIGQTGYFWSAYQRLKFGQSCPSELRSHFLSPAPLFPLGVRIKDRGLASASTDASDGLYAAVASLTAHHGLGADLDPLGWSLPAIVEETAEASKIAPWRLAMGFGDLQMVCAIDVGDYDELAELGTSHGWHVMRLGSVSADPGIKATTTGGRIGLVTNFDNERFSSRSQFTQGIAAYEAMLMRTGLVQDEGDVAHTDSQPRLS